jgi:hypothetical protein
MLRFAGQNQNTLKVSPKFWWRFSNDNRIAKSLGLTKVNGVSTARGNGVYTKNGKFYSARGNILKQFNYKGSMNANHIRVYALNKNQNFNRLTPNNVKRIMNLRARIPNMNLRDIYTGSNNNQIKKNYNAILKYQLLQPIFNKRLRTYLGMN